jgi:hypothetical protein
VCHRKYIDSSYLISLVNHHNQTEDPEEARDKAFKISYLSSERVIGRVNCLSIETVLSLHVEIVVMEEMEADGAVMDVTQSFFNVWDLETLYEPIRFSWTMIEHIQLK